jgi:DnaK suppressor protein
MDATTARERLLQRRAELIEEDRISVGRLSRIDAMQMQAMALAAQRRRAAERQRIDAALKRLDEGEFGYCLTCGEEIAGARLEHDPSVANCIQCASEA